MQNDLKQRMYCLVLYNISPIQQGIQALHAVVEYGNSYSNLDQYIQWANIDKTVIILNGGTSKGLQLHIEKLKELSVTHAIFREPDLFNGITAVCFLVDERIWDKEKYPDKLDEIKYDGNIVPAIFRSFNVEEYKKIIGGENNFHLKEYLSKLRLA